MNGLPCNRSSSIADSCCRGNAGRSTAANEDCAIEQKDNGADNGGSPKCQATAKYASSKLSPTCALVEAKVRDAEQPQEACALKPGTDAGPVGIIRLFMSHRSLIRSLAKRYL